MPPHSAKPRASSFSYPHISPLPSFSFFFPKKKTEWHRTLQPDGVKVWCISPGFLATGLGGNAEATRKLGAGDPAVVGPFVRGVLEGERDVDVGRVILREGVQGW